MNSTARSSVLWILTALFLARVFAQVMVGIYGPRYLPPWIEWYSGLLPYPWLFLAQLILLMFMAVVNVDNVRRMGRFHVVSAVARRRLRGFVCAYAGFMLLRYAIHMAQVPEARWFGDTIPIVFHLVLAAWLLVLALPGADGARRPS